MSAGDCQGGGAPLTEVELFLTYGQKKRNELPFFEKSCGKVAVRGAGRVRFHGEQSR